MRIMYRPVRIPVVMVPSSTCPSVLGCGFTAVLRQMITVMLRLDQQGRLAGSHFFTFLENKGEQFSMDYEQEQSDVQSHSEEQGCTH